MAHPPSHRASHNECFLWRGAAVGDRSPDSSWRTKALRKEGSEGKAGRMVGAEAQTDRRYPRRLMLLCEPSLHVVLRLGPQKVHSESCSKAGSRTRTMSGEGRGTRVC